MSTPYSTQLCLPTAATLANTFYTLYTVPAGKRAIIKRIDGVLVGASLLLGYVNVAGNPAGTGWGWVWNGPGAGAYLDVGRADWCVLNAGQRFQILCTAANSARVMLSGVELDVA